MKFVILSNSHESILNFRKELILEIQNKGYEICIIAPKISSSKNLMKFLYAHNMKFFEIDINRSSMNVFSELRYFFRLMYLLMKIKPKGILTYTIKPNLYGMIASYFLQVPAKFAMITGLGYLFRSKSNSIFAGVLKYLYGKSLNKADVIFCQNMDDLNTLIKLKVLSHKANAVCVNGSGVNLKHFHEEQFEDVQQINFLMIGRLLISKGVNEFVQASIKINEVYPKVKFSLLGWEDDNLDSVSKKTIDLIKKCDHLRLISSVEDVRPIIKKSHIFVLPSYHEGLPRSVLEAMAMGRPIITTDAPGCRDTVINSYNGYLVNKKSASELASAMEIFIKNPNSIFEMGKNSRALAEEKFDVNKVNQTMIHEMEKFFYK